MKFFSRFFHRHLNYKDRDMVTLALLIVLLFVCLSFFLTALQPLNYRADTQVLILQQQAINFDPYTSAKSAEKIGQNFTRIIPTTGFLTVIQQEFPSLVIAETNAAERRKSWQKKTDVQLFPETSILKISAYDQDPEKARQWAAGIARALEKRGSQFHGGGELVKLTTVDEPIPTAFPVQPNLLVRMLLGGVLGVLVSAVFLAKFAPRTWKRILPWREMLLEPVHDAALFKNAEASYDHSSAVLPMKNEPRMHKPGRPMRGHASENRDETHGDLEQIEVNPTLLSYLNFEKALAEPAGILDELLVARLAENHVTTMHDALDVKELSV